MTIVKIVLFIAILSSFGEHKGIQCKDLRINKFKSFSSKNFDTFHNRCYLVLFTYIFNELYQRLNLNHEIEIKEELNSSEIYFLRILRLHDSYVDYKIIKPPNGDLWYFYTKYNRYALIYDIDSIYNDEKVTLRDYIITTANRFIKYGEDMNVWNSIDLKVGNNFEYVMRDFNYCKTTLKLLSEPSAYLEQTIKNKMYTTSCFVDMMIWCESLTKFGYIINLMKRGEKNTLMLQKTIEEKESYIIRIMKSVLNRIFDGIISLLNEIHLTIIPTNIEMFYAFLEEDNEASNQLNIMIQLYWKAIDTTKEIYGIHGRDIPIVSTRRKKNEHVSTDISVQPSEFMMFITKFQAKFHSLCPYCFHLTNVTNQTVLNTKSSDSKDTGLPPIIGIYTLCWPNKWVPCEKIEDNIDLDVDMNIDSLNLKDKTLLQYNVYMTILYRYAIHFNGGSPTKHLKYFYECDKKFLENIQKKDQNKLKKPIIIIKDDD